MKLFVMIMLVYTALVAQLPDGDQRSQVAQLNCPQIIIENQTKTWNKHDQQTLEIATKRCQVHYPGYPCVIKFIKRSTRNYWVICGRTI